MPDKVGVNSDKTEEKKNQNIFEIKCKRFG